MLESLSVRFSLTIFKKKYLVFGEQRIGFFCNFASFNG